VTGFVCGSAVKHFNHSLVPRFSTTIYLFFRFGSAIVVLNGAAKRNCGTSVVDPEIQFLQEVGVVTAEAEVEVDLHRLLQQQLRPLQLPQPPPPAG